MSGSLRIPLLAISPHVSVDGHAQGGGRAIGIHPPPVLMKREYLGWTSESTSGLPILSQRALACWGLSAPSSMTANSLAPEATGPSARATSQTARFRASPLVSRLGTAFETRDVAALVNPDPEKVRHIDLHRSSPFKSVKALSSNVETEFENYIVFAGTLTILPSRLDDWETRFERNYPGLRASCES